MTHQPRVPAASVLGFGAISTSPQRLVKTELIRLLKRLAEEGAQRLPRKSS